MMKMLMMRTMRMKIINRIMDDDCCRLSGSNLHNNSRLLRELYQVGFLLLWFLDTSCWVVGSVVDHPGLQACHHLNENHFHHYHHRHRQRVVSLEQRNCQQEIRLGQVNAISINISIINVSIILMPSSSSWTNCFHFHHCHHHHCHHHRWHRIQ